MGVIGLSALLFKAIALVHPRIQRIHWPILQQIHGPSIIEKIRHLPRGPPIHVPLVQLFVVEKGEQHGEELVLMILRGHVHGRLSPAIRPVRRPSPFQVIFYRGFVAERDRIQELIADLRFSEMLDLLLSLADSGHSSRGV